MAREKIQVANFNMTGTPNSTTFLAGDGSWKPIIERESGTVAAPSYTFVGDTNTGMYRIAADTIGFSTNGIERIRIAATGVTFENNIIAGTGFTHLNGATALFDSRLVLKGNTVNVGNTLMITTNSLTNAVSGSAIRIGHVASSGSVDGIIDNLIGGAASYGHLIIGQGAGAFLGLGISPTQKLHVSGNGLVTGSITGNSLISNSSITGNSLVINGSLVVYSSVSNIKGSVATPANTAIFTTNTFTEGSSGSALRIGQGASSGNTVSLVDALQTGASVFGTLALQSGGGRVLIRTTTDNLTDALQVNGTISCNTFIYAKPAAASITGEIIKYGTGTTVAGRLYYLDTTLAWVEADADALVSSTGLLGIAVGTSPTTNGMLIKGTARFAGLSSYTAMTAGQILYMSTTPGEFTSTAPSGTGDVVRIIGYCVEATDDTLYFSPDNYWTQIP